MTQHWDDIADSVRSRVRRLVLVRGLAWLCAVTVGLMSLEAVVDAALHVDASWGRLCLLAGVVTASLTVLWRVLLRPLGVRLSDVDVARVIEQRLARSDDRLSSAAQFRSALHDPQLGSPELQQTTIVEADREIEGIDLEGLFDPTPGRRAALVATIVGVIALSSGLAAPLAARTALHRLLLPFANVAWPRTTRLQLLGDELQPLENEPLRTTAGEPFSAYVENELGPLPDDVTLDLELRSDVRQRQSLRTTLLRDRFGTAHEVGIVTILAYGGPVRFRVFGGDDNGTPWRVLDVVEAVTVADVSITVTPPAYTGRDTQLISGAGRIEGLVGSRVTIEGTATTPLSKASLHREQQSEEAMTIAEGGRRFRVEFDIEEAGACWYWLELADEHGLREPDPPRYELRGIADRPPVVYIDEPATDLIVTPSAELPLRVIARDDIGLSDLRLRFTDSADVPGETSDHAETASPAPSEAQSVPLPISTAASTEEEVETVWRLSPLELSPGARVTYWVEAVDACDLAATPGESSGQMGSSARRHLDVISESEKQRELAARQSGILETLDALRDRQAQARDITGQLRIQAELARRLRRADVDLLKQAEWEQHDIRRQVADESSGLAREIETMQRELETNRIEDPEASQRLAMLAEDLAELDARWLPMIEQALARARKSTGQGGDALGDSQTRQAADGEPAEASVDSSPVNEAVPQQLRDAEEAQAAALALLADAAKLLGGWRQRFHLSSELDSLLADQKQVQQETKDVGRETLAKAASRLSPQQQADLARLSDRQRRLATRLEQLLEPPGSNVSADDRRSTGNEESAPAPSQDLLEAQAWLRGQGTAGQMHQAAESLKRNEIPAAASAQQQVLAALRDFGERLNQTSLFDPETLLSELRDAQEQVETLRKQQETLAQSSQQAVGPTADPSREEQLQRLVKQQSDLALEAEDMARLLKRRRQTGAAGTADRAARRMRDAQQALEQQQPEGIAVNQQEALDDLDQLADELGTLRRQAEDELALRQLRQLADRLRELADEQQVLIDGTTDLDSRQHERGSWSRSLRRELRDLVERQRTLSTQLDDQLTDANDLPAVRAALESADEAMDRAATLLDQEQTGKVTVTVQQEAEERLLAVAEIVSATGQGAGDLESPPVTSPRAGGQQAPPPMPGLQLTTQLKLLRRMQADVHRRTRELTAAGGDETGADAIESSRDLLAREQGRIAELSRELLQQVIDAQRLLPTDGPAQEEPR